MSIWAGKEIVESIHRGRENSNLLSGKELNAQALNISDNSRYVHPVDHIINVSLAQNPYGSFNQINNEMAIQGQLEKTSTVTKSNQLSAEMIAAAQNIGKVIAEAYKPSVFENDGIDSPEGPTKGGGGRGGK